MRLGLIFIILCIFTNNLFSVITVVRDSLQDLYSRDLKGTIESGNQEDIERVLNYDIDTFQRLYPDKAWSLNPFTNEDLKAIKNTSFKILIDIQKIDELGINELEDILTIFLRHGLDINFQNPREKYCPALNYSPLMYAIKNNNNIMTELLIKYGADINQENYSRETPLMIALEINNPNIVSLLLALGADPHITHHSSNYLKSINNEAKNAYLQYLRERKQEILSEQKLYDDVANIINQY